MKKVYINGVGCISAQKTTSGFLQDALPLENTVVSVAAPVYKDYISPSAIRRMGKGVKNGIVASAIAIEDANASNLDAIITGSGMGCIEDSEKFLKAIIDTDEQFLTPTSFIQSTHNTVGGQIALHLQCNSYNLTYVNGGNSFEASLLDAKMQLEAGEAATVLIGGVDECGTHTVEFFKVASLVKTESDYNKPILESDTPGFIYSEGATFFVLGNEHSSRTYAEVIDVKLIGLIQPDEVIDQINAFLSDNQMSFTNIDAVVLGINGDVRYDVYYNAVRTRLFQNIPQFYYKHLSGEYHTASGFGLWMAAKILKTGTVPEIIRVNLASKPNIKTILLYNQFCGHDHSFTLIRNVQ